MGLKVIVTGANGQLGSSFQAITSVFPDLAFRFFTKGDLDISNSKAVVQLFEQIQPDYCINCAAYTAVDKAEDEKELAHLINAEAVANLAKACQSSNTQLFHFSSDYVYHNALNRPLKESDPTTPQSEYARSKLAGEQLALELNKETIIIRTSWVYSPYGHNFLKTMLRLGEERSELNVVYDQIGAPTYSFDLAYLVMNLIQASQKQALPSGVYNYANAGICSWFDYTKAIFELSGLDCHVFPILSEAYPTKASRPFYCILDTQKVQAVLKSPIPYWKDSLKDCLRVLKTLR